MDDDSDEDFKSNLEPRTFNSLQIGQFRVVGIGTATNGLFVIPRQYAYTCGTLALTVVPTLV